VPFIVENSIYATENIEIIRATSVLLKALIFSYASSLFYPFSYSYLGINVSFDR